MKKSIIISLSLVLCSMLVTSQARKSNVDRIEEAIVQSDFKSIKRLIRKLDAQDFNPQEKEKVFAQLAECAVDTSEDRENIALMHNYWDAAKCIGGTSLVVLSLGKLIHSFFGGSSKKVKLKSYDRDEDKSKGSGKNYLGIIGSLLVMPVGAYLGYKGYSCSVQQGKLKVARNIEKYLTNKAKEAIN